MTQLDSPPVARWLELIQAEYHEMPDLALTKTQMQRLWGLEPHVCDAILAALVAARVLRLRSDGRYVIGARSHRAG